MDFETESQKKKYGAGVFGDVYGVTMKELALEKVEPFSSPLSSPFELRFQVPDLTIALRVSLWVSLPFMWNSFYGFCFFPTRFGFPLGNFVWLLRMQKKITFQFLLSF